MTETLCRNCGAPSPAGVICWECTKRLHRLLADIRDDLAELDIQLTRQSRVGRGGIARAAEKPLPLDLRASELLDELRATVVTWVRDVCEREGDWPGNTLPAMLLRLRRHNWPVHPAAAAFLADLEDYHERALRIVDLPESRRYLGPCTAPRTRENGLHSHGSAEPGSECQPHLSGPQTDAYCDGDVYAVGARIPTCRHCGASYSRDERQRWIADLAADQLVTATEAAGALSAWGQHITGDLVRLWAFRGRLLPRGHDRHGRPVYAFAECRTLALETVKRRAERRREGRAHER